MTHCWSNWVNFGRSSTPLQPDCIPGMIGCEFSTDRAAIALDVAAHRGNFKASEGAEFLK
jgi:hypothetical protein